MIFEVVDLDGLEYWGSIISEYYIFRSIRFEVLKHLGTRSFVLSLFNLSDIQIKMSILETSFLLILYFEILFICNQKLPFCLKEVNQIENS